MMQKRILVIYGGSNPSGVTIKIQSIMINNLNDIINYSMDFIEDDYTELWVIVNKIQNENPEFNFESLIEATKKVVKKLVEKNNVQILSMDTQEIIELDVNEILQLVEEKFKILGRKPNIGDGIWFTLRVVDKLI